MNVLRLVRESDEATDRSIREKLAKLEARKRQLESEQQERWSALLRPRSNARPIKESKVAFHSLVQSTEAFERELIFDALWQCNWNKSKAARILGITRRILNYKVKVLEISNDES